MGESHVRMRGPLVLWVTDAPGAPEDAVQRLDALGFQVHRAATGTDALALARQHPYDVILLDLRLPSVERLALLEHQRACHRDTTAVLVSDDTTIGLVQAIRRDRALAVLIRMLKTPGLDTPTFARAAAAVRATLTPDAAASMPPATAAGRRRTAPVIARLEATHAHARVREADLASELGIGAAHLGRLLRAETGLTFNQWRWVMRLRGAVAPLVDSDEQIAQIAYRLGYDSPAQFDREFRRIFGITPTGFRRVVRALLPVVDDRGLAVADQR
jgi:AraC-like DNA-binding protein/CheY-like chemotaxis protein